MQEDPVLVRFLLARGACLVSRAVGAIFHAQAVPGGTDSNEEGSAPEPAPERVGGRLERKGNAPAALALEQSWTSRKGVCAAVDKGGATEAATEKSV